MDWVCRRLTDVLNNRNGLSLAELVNASGLARQTVFNHLKHLQELGAISRVERTYPYVRADAKAKRGRPVIGYWSMKGKVAWVEKKSDSVCLPFHRLKGACRHRSGDWCNTIKYRCIQAKCPLNK